MPTPQKIPHDSARTQIRGTFLLWGDSATPIMKSFETVFMCAFVLFHIDIRGVTLHIFSEWVFCYGLVFSVHTSIPKNTVYSELNLKKLLDLFILILTNHYWFLNSINFVLSTGASHKIRISWKVCFLCNISKSETFIYSGYGKYSDPLIFFTLCYIAAIC